MNLAIEIDVEDFEFEGSLYYGRLYVEGRVYDVSTSTDRGTYKCTEVEVISAELRDVILIEELEVVHKEITNVKLINFIKEAMLERCDDLINEELNTAYIEEGEGRDG